MAWKEGLESGFSLHIDWMSSNRLLPMSHDSGRHGRNGTLSPLRIRQMTSADDDDNDDDDDDDNHDDDDDGCLIVIISCRSFTNKLM